MMATPTSIRFSDDLRDRVEAIAEAEQRNFSQMVTVLLEEALRLRGRVSADSQPRDVEARTLKGRGGVTPGADPAGARPPRPLSVPSSSGGSTSRRARRSPSGAEPATATGASHAGEADDGSAESAPVSRRPRSGKCLHGVAAGTYCERCGE
jgi:hypothetical protein